MAPTDKYIGRINNPQAVINPANGSFMLNEHSEWDHLSYIVKLMEKINFFNSENQIDGNWAHIVKSDPLFYASTIISHSFKSLEDAQKAYDENKTELAAHKLGQELLDCNEVFERWIENLRDRKEFELSNKISGIKRSLVDRLIKDISFISTRTTNKDYQFSTIDYDVYDLSSLTFERVINHIKKDVQEHFKNSFFERSDHSPNNSIYLMFVKLLKGTINELNNIPKRHLSFYYNDVLQQEYRSATPTKTVVSFELNEDSEHYELIKSSRMTTHNLFENKVPFIFESNSPVHLHNCRLKNLYSVFLKRNKFLNHGTSEPIVSDILIQNLITNFEWKENLKAKDIGLFGGNLEKEISTSNIESSESQIGFTITSPALYLREGMRKIEILFRLDSERGENDIWRLAKEMAKNKKEAISSILFKVFRNAFKVSHTTENGWNDLPSYSMSFNPEKELFSIVLELEIESPPITLKKGDKYSFPAIKILLNNLSHIYVYSFLRTIHLKSIDINVEVSGIRNLDLLNNDGAVDKDKPYLLFGTDVKKGSEMKIGFNEISKKRIQQLSIDINWSNLPSIPNGLERHYIRYPEEVANDMFKVEFSLLHKGEWITPKEKSFQTANLFEEYTKFESGEEQIYLNTTSKLEFEGVELLSFPVKDDFTEIQEYNSQTLAGYVKLALVSPPEAFFSETYPKLLEAVIKYNALKKKDVPLPPAPFNPEVKSIELNYKATDSIEFQGNKPTKSMSNETSSEYFHIIPTGEVPVLQFHNVLDFHLVHNYFYEGNLYAEIANGLGDKILSIFIELDDRLTNASRPKSMVIFYYLYRNMWIQIEPRSLLQDGTLGFTRSGIIELRTPKIDLKNNDHTLFIRASIKENPSEFPFIKGIYLNAVEVTHAEDNNEYLGKNIPANSINKMLNIHPKIKKIIQPIPSYGGVEKESEISFYNRISHRLKHKDRAVRIWDFEQLILDEFQEVLIVKCTNKGSNFRPRAGFIIVSVIHRLWKVDNFNLFKSDELKKMHQFLNIRMKSFIKLKVINPVYEYLHINCSLKLSDLNRGGNLIAEINHEINEFLHPKNQISNGYGGIGGYFVPMKLVGFIKQLPQVIDLHSLEIEHTKVQNGMTYQVGVFSGNEMIKTSTPSSILVPVKVHNINISDRGFNVGLGQLNIGDNFVIGIANSEDKNLIRE